MRKPTLYGNVEPGLFDVVEQRGTQSLAKPGWAGSCGIGMAEIVFRKACELRSKNGETFRCRIQSDGTMGRGRELVPEGRLQEVICKKLPYAFE